MSCAALKMHKFHEKQKDGESEQKNVNTRAHAVSAVLHIMARQDGEWKRVYESTRPT